MAPFSSLGFCAPPTLPPSETRPLSPCFSDAATFAAFLVAHLTFKHVFYGAEFLPPPLPLRMNSSFPDSVCSWFAFILSPPSIHLKTCSSRVSPSLLTPFHRLHLSSHFFPLLMMLLFNLRLAALSHSDASMCWLRSPLRYFARELTKNLWSVCHETDTLQAPKQSSASKG